MASRNRPGRTPAQVAAAREERLNVLHAQLAEGVASVRSSQGWKEWLDVAARFPRYSWRNSLLIKVQAPHATAVCGYRAWLAMGRQVRKGEKGIFILAPVVTRNPRAVPDEQLAAEAAQSPDGKPAARLVGFKPASVFALEQTDGDPVPTPPRAQLLEGQAPEGLWEAVAGIIEAQGFTLTRAAGAAEIGGANGQTNFTTRTVTIRGDVDDSQAAKTALHELGHILLHCPEAGEGVPLCRGTIEVEAESVAYLVGAHHGLDTSGYTFNYIAGWAPDDETVARTAARVTGAARQIIDITDPAPTPSQDTATVVAAAVTEAAGLAAHAEATATAAEAGLAPTAGPRARVLAVNAAAQEWFIEQALTTPEFTKAVTDRGHTVEAATGYGVGYAPRGWTALTDHLQARGFTLDELVAAGVTHRTEAGRTFDQFRGRVTFPITDHTSQVVGFTARDVTGNPSAPKYLNTPANGVYDKAAILFGTQHVNDHTLNVVLVEGPWDALAVTSATRGEPSNAVGLAACGTAITTQHVDLAQATGRDVVLCLDADPAGLKALGRLTDLITDRQGYQPRAVPLPAGTDLGDLHTTGPANVRDALSGSRAAGVVYADTWLALNGGGDNAVARVGAARAASGHRAGLTPQEQGQLGGTLLARTGLTPEAVLALLTDNPRRRLQHPKATAPIPAQVPGASPALALAHGRPGRSQ